MTAPSPVEDPTPGFLVWRLSMKWRAAVDRTVAPFGLTHAQYSVLASLLGMTRRGQQPSQRELADFTGLEPIYTSKLVRTLEAAGLVRRSGHPTDTRALQLDITPQGREVAKPAIAAVLRLQDQLTAPLGGRRGAGTRALIDALQTLLAVPPPEPQESPRPRPSPAQGAK